MAERWRKVPASRMYRVPGGWFEASSDGNVRVASSGEVLGGSPDDEDYLRVTHRKRRFFKHVLVILGWQGEPQVRHLNGNCQDNRPENLAWGSKRENERDKRENRREGKGEVSPPAQRLQPVTGDLLR